MLNNISNDLKKIVLAGIGAVATTAEKSRQMLDELVKKGEFTVEQGKILNEELKRNVRNMPKENCTDAVGEEKATASSIVNQLGKMSKKEIADLKDKLAEIERANADGETTGQ
ncbi:MAG TPA: phasin family protein [Ruminiclostridium sp.]